VVHQGVPLSHNPSGHETFSIATIQGKNKKFVSFIAAYIAVNKGSNVGIDSVYANQTNLYEHQCITSDEIPNPNYCPRKAAIQHLDSIIQSLQQQHHSIVLMLDANQASHECYTTNSIHHHSIKWLCTQRGLDDPFVQLTGRGPFSTTQTPGRDINYVFTFGIKVDSISTLTFNTAAISDHLGIILDINLAAHVSSQYYDLLLNIPRMLTSGNKKSVDSYLSYVRKQIGEHKLLDRVQDLYNQVIRNPSSPPIHFSDSLNNLDTQLTEILLAGEKTCMKKLKFRQDWSPTSQKVARQYSYWKQKLIMVNKKLLHRDHLEKLRKGTDISQLDHDSLDSTYIKEQLKKARNL
jgi:hypothetical protein